MLVYCYDGTFEGLLTAIFEAYDRHEHPERICEMQGMQMGLMDEQTIIETDTEKAGRVQAGIINKMGQSGYETVYTAYLTPHPERSTVIYQYVRMGLKLGAALEERFDDPLVMKMVHYNRQVGGECQLLKGFVRFRAVDDVYYALIGPTNDVLEMLAPHFASRFHTQQWVMQDEKRNKAVFSSNGQWAVVLDPDIVPPPIGEEEGHYRALWRAFHQTLSNETRYNPKHQMHMMPKKFWKYMVEMNGVSKGVDAHTGKHVGKLVDAMRKQGVVLQDGYQAPKLKE